MSRPPKRRRPPRTRHWEGVVDEIYRDSFWAMLAPADRGDG